MRRRTLFVDLPKDRRAMIDGLPALAQQTRRSTLDRFGKRQFGPRQHAHRNEGILRGSEPTRAGTKVSRGQLFADLRGS